MSRLIPSYVKLEIKFAIMGTEEEQTTAEPNEQENKMRMSFVLVLK